MRKLVIWAALAVALSAPASAVANTFDFEARSLDGGGNNVAHPTWGAVGTQYGRVAPPYYANGIGSLVYQSNAKLAPRFISNRIFNNIDTNTNTDVTLFSEQEVSQFGWLWGQFVDHTIVLRDE